MSRKKAPQLGIFLGTGDRIRQIRGDLTQTEFGKLFGVKGNTVSRWEDGRLSDDETIKKIADYGEVTVEWLLRGEKKAAAQLREFAPEQYDARPAVLNVNYLVQANFLTRKFLKSKRLAFSDHQEAQLSAYIYEYLIEFHADPGEVVIRRLADLIQRQRQED
jgi:transcriptional regulator with XRE-family HTH domain